MRDNRMQKGEGGVEKETSIVGLRSRKQELYNYIHLKQGELEEGW
jgi:hypothetical protein